MFKPTIHEVLSQIQETEAQCFTVAYPIELKHELWFPLFEEINHREAYHLLLESGRAGRYSVMAYRPTHHLRGKDKKLTIVHLASNGETLRAEQLEGNLLALLKAWMQEKRVPRFEGLPDINGGLFGFFSYDLVREVENLPRSSADDLHTPDVNMLVFDQIIVYDHKQQQHWLIINQPVDAQEHSSASVTTKRMVNKGNTRPEQIKAAYDQAQQRLTEWSLELKDMLSQLAPNCTSGVDLHDLSNPNATVLGPMIPSFSEEQFVQAVERVQAYISAGDVFQVNLSVRQSRPLYVPPLLVYKHLRAINPSPYMGYLHFPDLQIISGSPEQLIKLKGTELSTRPIAGTRPRGLNREQDLQLARELIEHEKERAEHVMLVDLERNDLGKVSVFGSVEVNEFMVIEEYSHVMHIVSNVRGELDPDKDAFDVIEAVFPGGTITGAPKVRTMEIIEELEPVRRGLYTGSIGWINFNGDMELNIVIRTMLVQNDNVYVQAGAGIVIDSVPANEYQESLNKAKALWKAYELSVKEEQQKQSKELRMS